MTEVEDKTSISLYGVTKAYFEMPENVRGFEEWQKKKKKAEKEVNPNE